MIKSFKQTLKKKNNHLLERTDHMDFNELSPQQELFLKVVHSGIGKEIFMENGENFFPS